MALWVYAVHTLRVMKQTIHDNNHNKNENCNSSAVLLLERRTWELGCRAPQVGAEGPGKAMKRQTSICPGSAHRHRPGEKYESLKKKKHSGPPPSSWARSSWSLWRRRYAAGTRRCDRQARGSPPRRLKWRDQKGGSVIAPAKMQAQRQTTSQKSYASSSKQYQVIIIDVYHGFWLWWVHNSLFFFGG